MEASQTPQGRAVLDSELCQLLTTHSGRLWDVVAHQQQHVEVLRSNAIDVANVERSCERKRMVDLTATYEEVFEDMQNQLKSLLQRSALQEATLKENKNLREQLEKTVHQQDRTIAKLQERFNADQLAAVKKEAANK